MSPEQEPQMSTDKITYEKFGETNLSQKIKDELSVLKISPEIFLSCVNDYLSEREKRNPIEKMLKTSSVGSINLDLKLKLEDKVERDNKKVINLIVAFLKENGLLEKDFEIIIDEPEQTEQEVPFKKVYSKKILGEAEGHRLRNMPTQGSHDDDL